MSNRRHYEPGGYVPVSFIQFAELKPKRKRKSAKKKIIPTASQIESAMEDFKDIIDIP